MAKIKWKWNLCTPFLQKEQYLTEDALSRQEGKTFGSYLAELLFSIHVFK